MQIRNLVIDIGLYLQLSDRKHRDCKRNLRPVGIIRQFMREQLVGNQ